MLFFFFSYCLDIIPDADDADFTWSCVQCVSTVVTQSSISDCNSIPVFRSLQKRKGVQAAKNIQIKKKDEEDGIKSLIAHSEVQTCDVAAPSRSDCPSSSKDSRREFVKDKRLQIASDDDKKINGEDDRSAHHADEDQNYQNVQEKLVDEDGESSEEEENKCQPQTRKGNSDGHRDLKRRSVFDDEGSSDEDSEIVKEDQDSKQRKRKLIMSDVSDEEGEFSGDKQSIIASDSHGSPVSIFSFDPCNKEGKDILLQIHLDAPLPISSVDPSRGYPNYAQPFIDPAWRGCFDVESARSIRLKAHLSTKAGLKVFQGAKSLQPLLQMKMLRRRDTWPKSFEVLEPSDDHIALFFFPELERDVNSYDLLVDNIIKRDLALKTEIDNGELLVFSSRKLPEPFQRFLGKNYLWGVFRGRQALLDQKSVEHICTDAKQISEGGLKLGLRSLSNTSSSKKPSSPPPPVQPNKKPGSPLSPLQLNKKPNSPPSSIQPNKKPISPRSPLPPKTGFSLPKHILVSNTGRGDHQRGPKKSMQTSKDGRLNNTRTKQESGQALSRFAPAHRISQF
ncbi:hypothetical protein GIB67_036097 [Kingdonia uniflora]|uniref:AIPP2-like SPOC-like domain-containing protein n=1 Tax=Kingdonia uniflora TaxID=39325 RepID=A0A7J7N922_9MAGN|nr:hypothetical protein GIB67_036097 [Kingdonia uniflora]